MGGSSLAPQHPRGDPVGHSFLHPSRTERIGLPWSGGSPVGGKGPTAAGPVLLPRPPYQQAATGAHCTAHLCSTTLALLGRRVLRTVPSWHLAGALVAPCERRASTLALQWRPPSAMPLLERYDATLQAPPPSCCPTGADPGQDPTPKGGGVPPPPLQTPKWLYRTMGFVGAGDFVLGIWQG